MEDQISGQLKYLPKASNTAIAVAVTTAVLSVFIMLYCVAHFDRKSPQPIYGWGTFVTLFIFALTVATLVNWLWPNDKQDPKKSDLVAARWDENGIALANSKRAETFTWSAISRVYVHVARGKWQSSYFGVDTYSAGSGIDCWRFELSELDADRSALNAVIESTEIARAVARTGLAAAA